MVEQIHSYDNKNSIISSKSITLDTTVNAAFIMLKIVVIVQHSSLKE